MQETVSLRDLFSYSSLPVILLFTFLLLCIILFLITQYMKKRPKKLVIVPAKNIYEIKQKYFIKLDQLTLQVQNKTISNRNAYQLLSSIIRNFIYDVTGIRVQNYSLAEIESLNISFLTDLVKEYYDPEFAKESGGNILTSIERTRGVIQLWK